MRTIRPVAEVPATFTCYSQSRPVCVNRPVVRRGGCAFPVPPRSDNKPRPTFFSIISQTRSPREFSPLSCLGSPIQLARRAPFPFYRSGFHRLLRTSIRLVLKTLGLLTGPCVGSSMGECFPVYLYPSLVQLFSFFFFSPKTPVVCSARRWYIKFGRPSSPERELLAFFFLDTYGSASVLLYNERVSCLDLLFFDNVGYWSSPFNLRSVFPVPFILHFFFSAAVSEGFFVSRRPHLFVRSRSAACRRIGGVSYLVRSALILCLHGPIFCVIMVVYCLFFGFRQRRRRRRPGLSARDIRFAVPFCLPPPPSHTFYGTVPFFASTSGSPLRCLS